MSQGCGHCHECGEPLRRGLPCARPPYEWCGYCHAIRYYASHGMGTDESPCIRSLIAKSVQTVPIPETEEINHDH